MTKAELEDLAFLELELQKLTRILLMSAINNGVQTIGAVKRCQAEIAIANRGGRNDKYK